ncbi:MAG: hypothetical protein EOP42_00850 [Sphingobacteriaceae bacterium]|nr:MAG: hypothetical protein EOP42_00850 [Sphingobacteriaceae bacterium]
MGEKSFDHAKKYRFNQLRRTYPLAEVKPHHVQAEAITATAVQAVAVAAAQNTDSHIERPNFKEDNLPELVDEHVDKQDVSLAQEEKLITDAVTEKPVFKPRFNPKSIPKTNAATPEQTVNEEVKTEPVKPAFKPRFNMQNIKKDVVKTASETDLAAQEPVAENNQDPEVLPADTEQIKVIPAFKPRFNPKNIPKQITEPPTEAVSENDKITASQPNEQIPENQPVKIVSENENDSDLNQTPATEQQTEKPVYKPRFQMKNIKKPQADPD